MSLSPAWVEVLRASGVEAVHWSAVGEQGTTDRRIMDWARANGYVVFTHDLDFGALLAASHAGGPSVIQVRAQDVLAAHLAGVVIDALQRYRSFLDAGALISMDEDRARVRILPITR